MISKVSATWDDVLTSNRVLAVITGQRLQFKESHMAGTRAHGLIRLLKYETRSSQAPTSSIEWLIKANRTCAYAPWRH